MREDVIGDYHIIGDKEYAIAATHRCAIHPDSLIHYFTPQWPHFNAFDRAVAWAEPGFEMTNAQSRRLAVIRAEVTVK